jgi:hypothetical protein
MQRSQITRHRTGCPAVRLVFVKLQTLSATELSKNQCPGYFDALVVETMRRIEYGPGAEAPFNVHRLATRPIKDHSQQQSGLIGGFEKNLNEIALLLAVQSYSSMLGIGPESDNGKFSVRAKRKQSRQDRAGPCERR